MIKCGQQDDLHSKAMEDLDLAWSALEEPAHGLLNKWNMKGHHQRCSHYWSAPLLPAVHENLIRTWSVNTRPVNPSASTALTIVDGPEVKGYSKLPLLKEAVAVHWSPPSALGMKVHAAHPSKPCRTTSALARRAYLAAGQAGSALHTMVALQVFQDKRLCSMDKSGQDSDAQSDQQPANLNISPD